MHKRVMAVSDQVGFGKVALSAQVPILTSMGFEVFSLPTCYVSNTFDYGKVSILDTTEVMEPTLKTWSELDFEFDAISLGYLLNKAQLELMGTFIEAYRMERLSEAKPFICLMDPIMGDNGELYKGNTIERVDIVRDMASKVDILTPNVTEASFLAKRYEGRQQLSFSEAEDLAHRLYDLTGAICVITSAVIEGRGYIIIYDGAEYHLHPYEHVPANKIAGTGDTFSAILLGKLLHGHPLREAVVQTASILTLLIRRYSREYDDFHGIPMELALKDIELM